MFTEPLLKSPNTMNPLIVAIGLLLSYLIGTKFVEKRHYRSIIEREKKYEDLRSISVETLDFSAAPLGVTTGSVVISIDPFKRFVAGLVNIFGGNVSTYETLLDRARREAILRAKENAEKMGASGLLNMRVETSSINRGSRGVVGAVEVLVFATAIRV